MSRLREQAVRCQVICKDDRRKQTITAHTEEQCKAALVAAGWVEDEGKWICPICRVKYEEVQSPSE